MSTPLIDEIPGYREAVERERELRESSFNGIPNAIGGVDVLPWTLAHMVRLTAAQSPFVTSAGRFPTCADVGVFLWCVSPDYDAALRARRSLAPWAHWLSVVLFYWMKSKFYKRLWRTLEKSGGDWLTWTNEIVAYLDEAYLDGPSSSGGVAAVPYYSLPAAMVARFAESFGWNREQIMNEPLSNLHQYLKAVKHFGSPQSILFNKSDSLKSRFLDTLNGN